MSETHRGGRAPQPPPQRLKPLGSGTHLLGIGINAYAHWPRLHNAVRDVQAVARLLETDYGLLPQHIHLLLDEAATYQGIIEALERMADRVKAPESLIIYYAGHGHLHRERGYWTPVDARRGAIPGLIPNSTLRDYIADIPSLHTLLLSDACFSGTLFVRSDRAERGSDLHAQELAGLASRWIICSGRHDETVSDGPPGGHSPFAQSILDVLGSSTRPYITANFLQEQVMGQTRANYSQLPDGGPLTEAGHRRGQYVFVRSRNEAAAWQESQAANTPEAYHVFLADFPQSPHASEARLRIKRMAVAVAWQVIQAAPEDTPTQAQQRLALVQRFCREHEESAHYPEALQLGQTLEDKVAFLNAYDSIFRLRQFILRDTPFRAAARQRLVELEGPPPAAPAVAPPPKAADKPPQTPPPPSSGVKTTENIPKPQEVVHNGHLGKEDKNDPKSNVPTPPLLWYRRPRALGTLALLLLLPLGWTMWKVFEAPPAGGTQTSVTPNTIASIATNMTQVPGGTFTMGCQNGRDTDCFDDEKPTHEVTLSTYYISQYEVTQAQWRAVMGSYPPELYNQGCDLCPVEGVSWDDIQDFLRKLNAQTGQNYRLPTEAEWEYAARGGAGSRGYLYSGSNTIGEVAWYDGNSGSKTHTVGGKKANELGLYDMSGNVWEWCEDDWHSNYQGAPADGRAWVDEGRGTYRVNRGGGWILNPQFCRAADRFNAAPTLRDGNLGFRLAR